MKGNVMVAFGLISLVVGLAIVLGALGVEIDKDSAKRAAARKASPPVVEVQMVTDSESAFPVYLLHDRQTGAEWLVFKNGGRIVTIRRDGADWRMDGDEVYRPKVEPTEP